MSHSATIAILTPPEVILDRWIKERSRRHEGTFSEYAGTADISRVEPPSYSSLLQTLKENVNEALSLEGPNASGGVEHPPFHFDYVEVHSPIQNAHAFQDGGFSFIAVTLPMVELIVRASRRLSRAPVVLERLGLADRELDLDGFHGLLCQIQMNFLVSHEYTHHIHRHCVENGAAAGVWNEFHDDAQNAGLDSQAQELIADGFATMLSLSHLLRGERRASTLEQLGRPAISQIEGDELLLTCFFVAIITYFCSFWHRVADIAALRQSTHPSPPVRIKHVINVSEMWCGLYESVPKSWFGPLRLQGLFSAATESVELAMKETWDAQIALLGSAAGDEYDRQLFARFEELRRNPGGQLANDRSSSR